MIVSVVNSAGGKAPDIAPYPRPTTAFQRAHADTQRERHASLVTRLLPK